MEVVGCVAGAGASLHPPTVVQVYSSPPSPVVSPDSPLSSAPNSPVTVSHDDDDDASFDGSNADLRLPVLLERKESKLDREARKQRLRRTASQLFSGSGNGGINHVALLEEKKSEDTADEEELGALLSPARSTAQLAVVSPNKSPSDQSTPTGTQSSSRKESSADGENKDEVDALKSSLAFEDELIIPTSSSPPFTEKSSALLSKSKPTPLPPPRDPIDRAALLSRGDDKVDDDDNAALLLAPLDELNVQNVSFEESVRSTFSELLSIVGHDESQDELMRQTKSLGAAGSNVYGSATPHSVQYTTAIEDAPLDEVDEALLPARLVYDERKNIQKLGHKKSGLLGFFEDEARTMALDIQSVTSFGSFDAQSQRSRGTTLSLPGGGRDATRGVRAPSSMRTNAQTSLFASFQRRNYAKLEPFRQDKVFSIESQREDDDREDKQNVETSIQPNFENASSKETVQTTQAPILVDQRSSAPLYDELDDEIMMKRGCLTHDEMDDFQIAGTGVSRPFELYAAPMNEQMNRDHQGLQSGASPSGNNCFGVFENDTQSSVNGEKAVRRKGSDDKARMIFPTAKLQTQDCVNEKALQGDEKTDPLGDETSNSNFQACFEEELRAAPTDEGWDNGIVPSHSRTSDISKDKSSCSSERVERDAVDFGDKHFADELHLVPTDEKMSVSHASVGTEKKSVKKDAISESGLDVRHAISVVDLTETTTLSDDCSLEESGFESHKYSPGRSTSGTTDPSAFSSIRDHHSPEMQRQPLLTPEECYSSSEETTMMANGNGTGRNRRAHLQRNCRPNLALKNNTFHEYSTKSQARQRRRRQLILKRKYDKGGRSKSMSDEALLPPLVIDPDQLQSIGVKALMSVCNGIGSLFLSNAEVEASAKRRIQPGEQYRKLSPDGSRSRKKNQKFSPTRAILMVDDESSTSVVSESADPLETNCGTQGPFSEESWHQDIETEIGTYTAEAPCFDEALQRSMEAESGAYIPKALKQKFKEIEKELGYNHKEQSIVQNDDELSNDTTDCQPNVRSPTAPKDRTDVPVLRKRSIRSKSFSVPIEDALSYDAWQDDFTPDKTILHQTRTKKTGIQSRGEVPKNEKLEDNDDEADWLSTPRTSGQKMWIEEDPTITAGVDTLHSVGQTTSRPANGSTQSLNYVDSLHLNENPDDEILMEKAVHFVQEDMFDIQLNGVHLESLNETEKPDDEILMEKAVGSVEDMFATALSTKKSTGNLVMQSESPSSCRKSRLPSRERGVCVANSNVLQSESVEHFRKNKTLAEVDNWRQAIIAPTHKGSLSEVHSQPVLHDNAKHIDWLKTVQALRTYSASSEEHNIVTKSTPNSINGPQQPSSDEWSLAREIERRTEENDDADSMSPIHNEKSSELQGTIIKTRKGKRAKSKLNVAHSPVTQDPAGTLARDDTFGMLHDTTATTHTICSKSSEDIQSDSSSVVPSSNVLNDDTSDEQSLMSDFLESRLDRTSAPLTNSDGNFLKNEPLEQTQDCSRSDSSSTENLLSSLADMVQDLDSLADARRSERSFTSDDSQSSMFEPSKLNLRLGGQLEIPSGDVEDNVNSCEQYEKMPILIESLDNEDGIPKGDVMISLLSSDQNTGAASWNNRVDEAIWRMRTIRKSSVVPSKDQGRTSVCVDVDDLRIMGGIDKVPDTQRAAIELLARGDESAIDEAEFLLEDVLCSYENLAKSVKAKAEDPFECQRNISSALHNLGIVHLIQGQHEESFEYFQRATLSRAEHLGVGHADHISSLVKAAMCRFALEDYSMAYVDLDEALTLSRERSTTLSDQCQLAEILSNLGCLSYFGGELTQAGRFFNESLHIQGLISHQSIYIASGSACLVASLNFSITQANLGFLSLVSRDVKDSIATFEDALKNQQLLLSGSDTTLMKTIEHLVVANLLAGRKGRAIQLLNRVYHMQVQSFGESDERVICTQDKIKALEHGLSDDTSVHAIPVLDTITQDVPSVIKLMRENNMKSHVTS